MSNDDSIHEPTTTCELCHNTYPKDEIERVHIDDAPTNVCLSCMDELKARLAEPDPEDYNEDDVNEQYPRM